MTDIHVKDRTGEAVDRLNRRVRQLEKLLDELDADVSEAVICADLNDWEGVRAAVDELDGRIADWRKLKA